MVNLTKLFKSIVSVILCSMLMAMPVSAMSLWSDTTPTNLYSDHKAAAVGDIITIIISENSSASRAGKANNSKSANASADAGAGVFHWIANASAKSSDNFQANGSIANSNNVTAKMTAKVTEVKSNGNLVISGTQSIKQNGEEQKITVTGVVRADDITSDNTVLSTYVADAQIHVDGNGPIASKQRQGILTQIFNFLF